MPRKTDNPVNGLNLTLFPPESDWEIPREFPNLSGVKELGFDCETRDPNLLSKGPGGLRNDGEMVGFSLATRDKKWYFPFKHLGGSNMDQASCINFAKDIFEKNGPGRTLVGHNTIYELEWFNSIGVNIKSNLVDTLVTETLIDEEAESYSLNAIAQKYLGECKDETLLREAASNFRIDPKSEMWKLDAKYVGPYGETDAQLPLLIFDKQKSILHEQQLEIVHQMEMELIPLIWEMRKRGVPIDTEKAQRLSNEWDAIQHNLQGDIFRDYGVQMKTGYEIDKIQYVCDTNKIQYPLTAKTRKPSITKAYIEAQTHPFFETLKDLRELDRLKGTYVDKLFFEHAYNGRIHCQFKSTRMEEGGTRSGRFASSNPNLQQIPSRAKIAHLIRSCFIPDQGFRWAKWDYSQQEPRIMLHFAAAVGCIGAADAIQFMRDNPDKKFYDLAQKAANISYRDAKDVTLGRQYFMGDKKMSKKLNQPIDRCREILKKFDSANPFVRDIAERMMNAADRRGYIKTILGRRSRFELWEPCEWRERDFKGDPVDGDPKYLPLEQARELWKGKRLRRALTYKALNRSVQGTGAEMIKMSMLKMWKEDGYVPYLTVHDELDGPVADREEAEYRQRVMETAIEFSCPIKADLDLEDNWK